jgi:hypothetical protein
MKMNTLEATKLSKTLKKGNHMSRPNFKAVLIIFFDIQGVVMPV